MKKHENEYQNEKLIRVLTLFNMLNETRRYISIFINPITLIHMNQDYQLNWMLINAPLTETQPDGVLQSTDLDHQTRQARYKKIFTVNSDKIIPKSSLDWISTLNKSDLITLTLILADTFPRWGWLPSPTNPSVKISNYHHEIFFNAGAQLLFNSHGSKVKFLGKNTDELSSLSYPELRINLIVALELHKSNLPLSSKLNFLRKIRSEFEKISRKTAKLESFFCTDAAKLNWFTLYLFKQNNFNQDFMNIVNPNYYDKDTTIANLRFILYRLEKQDPFGASAKTEISILEEKINKAWSVKSTRANSKNKQLQIPFKTYELLQSISKKTSRSKASILKKLLEDEIKRLEASDLE